ncbi:MAG: class I SAM-dependent methyltransferase, partial [Pseudomonadales bacterium]|nr:class I SAM-dependent methyltransferase [Pseudomonadales bacterium]
EEGLAENGELVRRGEEAVCRYVVAAVAGIVGGDGAAGRVVDVEAEVLSRVVEERRLQVKKLLSICIEGGRFDKAGEGGEGGAGAAVVVVNEKSNRVWSMSAGERAEYVREGKEEAGEAGWLLYRSGEGLKDVLVGSRDGVEVLFGGEWNAIRDVYRRVGGAGAYNGMMCEALGQVIGDGLGLRRGGAVLRVLEIGGGTGGLTHALLPVLEGLGIAVEYVFTDIGAMFLRKAEEEFGAEYPWVRYGILDIESSGVDQGYERGGFDLIVAANVLHATENIVKTMERVGELLGRGGMLMMLEVDTPPTVIEMAFGMTSGWWAWASGEGDGVRKDHACMGVGQWKEVLSGVGFERTVGVVGWDG